jgi:periplasmic mercuric ion binding protein
MKTIFGIIAILLSSFAVSFAQDKKDIVTEKIKVSGLCGDCKKRIEKAAYVPGVKRAEWDSNTQILTVIYRPSKTSVDKIETSIVTVGYDAGDMKASEEAYNKLPQCCAYREEDAHVHEN